MSKRRRTQSPPPRSRREVLAPRTLANLPSDLLGTVAGFTEHSPAQQTAWKKWHDVDTRRCARDTKQGLGCLRSDPGRPVMMSSGCVHYCLGRGPCVAWVEQLLVAVRKVDGVVLRADGPVRPVLAATVMVVQPDWNSGSARHVYKATSFTGDPLGWILGEKGERIGTREMASAMCDAFRLNRPDSLVLALVLILDRDLEADAGPVSAKAETEPIFHSRAEDFRAEALPRTWDSHGIFLSVSIDLADWDTMTCRSSTLLGRRCLTKAGLSKECSAYCLRTSGPCEAWVAAICQVAESSRFVTLTSLRRPLRGGQSTATFEALSRIQVLDAEGRPLVHVPVPVPASEAPSRAKTLAALLCASISSPQAKALRVVVDLSKRSLEGLTVPDLVESSGLETEDYLFEFKSQLDSMPTKSAVQDQAQLHWNLRLSDSPPWRLSLEALVPLRSR